MALEKRNYTDGETVIPASNLNDIQDEIIDLQGRASTGSTLTKRTYHDGETVISASNLNDIQDAIIALQNASFNGDSGSVGGTGGGTDSPFYAAEEFTWTAPSLLKSGDEVSIEYNLGAAPDGVYIVALGASSNNVINNVIYDSSLIYANNYPFVDIRFNNSGGDAQERFIIVADSWKPTSTKFFFTIPLPDDGEISIPAGKQYRVFAYKRR